MRTKAAGFVIAAVLAGVACGQQSEQSVDRVFYLTHAGMAREFQEIATVIRAVADIREVSTDSEKKSITVRGTAAQMALAEWLVNALDSPNPAAGEYRVTAGADDVARVFYFTHAGSPQILQEAVTTIRTIVDVRRAFIYNARSAVALRGTAAQMALAEWLVNALDGPNPAAGEYRVPAGGDDVVRVFYLTHAGSPQIVEAITTIRAIADVQRAFIYNARKAMALRGTAGQMALAAWLVNELDKPAPGQPNLAPQEYRPAGSSDLVRVFYLSHTETPQGLQKIAVAVRSTTSIRRMFVNNAPRALAVRGTVEQVAAAARLVQELDSAK